MGKVVEGKYKLIKDYTSIEGALYTNEVVRVYDNNLDIYERKIVWVECGLSQKNI